MATGKKTQIVITANAAVAKKVMDELQQRIDGIKQKMTSLDVTTKQGQREFKKLEKELVSYNSATAQNITNTERINKAIKNLSGTSLNELKRALSAAKSELGKMSEGDKGLKQMQGNVKVLQGQIDKLTGSVHKQGGAWNTAMKSLTAYVGMFALFNKAKDLVTGAIKKNFEYSGSLTDIRKVSGLTMDQVKQLSTELAKIDTRTSVDGLAQLAYQGAKLGMGKYGVEGMAQFVKAADKINVAIGEEMGEEALPALSKMVEVMGLIPKMGIDKAMEATGSAMFKLSSTSTSTSSDIVEFAKRLTGVARTAGITTDQLLALGSASSSMMLMPEVASTAMGKFIVALQKNHNLIAKELGIPDETIKNLYASGHAMDAIVLVLEKMRDKGNMNALGGIFKDLGSDGQRLVTAMVTMSKNVDMLKDHLYESKEAFDEATAVTNEYNQQQQSAIGILERANNLWEKAFVNPDGVDAVKGMAEWWYEMSKTMTSSPLLKGTLQVALQSVLWALRVVATLLPVIIGYIASQGVYSGLRLLGQYILALGVAIKSMYQYARALFTANAAQSTLNKTMKLNPWIALASVIIGVAGAIYGYTQRAREAAKAEKEAQRQANAWRETLGKAAVETSDLNKKLANYKRMMNEATLSQKDRQTLISRFNRDFRSYISKLGIEIKSVKDLRDHYSELAQEAQKATYYRLREQAKQQALPKLDEARNTAANALMSQVDKLGISKLGVTFQDIDRWVSAGLGGDALFWKLAKTMSVDKSGLLKGAKWKLDKKGFVYRESYDKSKVGLANPQMQYDLRDLLSVSRWYVNATRRRSNKENEINGAYKNFVPEGYTPYPEETPGTLENNAKDKDAIAQAARDKRDRERAWREELKQKQDEANAVMDNVRNFYERQINAKMEQAISLGMDKSEQDLFVEPVKQRMNEALEQVRLAIAGQANTWEQYKLTMKDDLIEQTDETGVNLSESLLKGITSSNIDALRKKLEGLANSLNRPVNSVMAEIFAKATKNAQDNLKLITQQQEARRKAMQEHDYTGGVKQSAYNLFNTMGYANPAAEETTVKKSVVDGKEVLDTSAFDNRKKRIIAMFEKARTDIASVFSIDVNKEEGRGMLMKLLFGDDPDGMGKRIAETLGKDTAEWQGFYQKLIQYNDEYIAAEKKRYDEAKKLTDQKWATDKRNLQMQKMMAKLQNDASLFGKRTSFLSNLGLADVAADPQVMIMKARLEAADTYYKNVKANSDNQQLIDEKEKARQDAELAYTNQVAAAMKERLSLMKSLVDPIVSFGTAMGEAFAKMSEDAESANEAIQSALKSMLQAWGQMLINDVNTQMWKAINDGGVRESQASAGSVISSITGSAVGAGANALMNTGVSGSSSRRKKELKDAKKQEKELADIKKKGAKEQEKAVEKGQKNMTQATKEGSEEQKQISKIGQEAMLAGTEQVLATTISAKKKTDDEAVKSEADSTEARMNLSLAGAVAKCFDFLGPIAGPIAAAVVTATLNGLLQWAISSAFSKKSSSNKNSNLKVTSGMLTYDSGNVQDLSPFVSEDGSLYWAQNDGKNQHSGVNLLTAPTATTINGHPSLVAERGPELVIGRETTKAMMMNNPQLLKALVNYDRNYSGRRAYDNGNIAENASTIASQSPATDEATISQTVTNAALLQAVNTLLQRLSEPMVAKIDMYGRGNLYDSMTKASRFMKNK